MTPRRGLPAVVEVPLAALALCLLLPLLMSLAAVVKLTSAGPALHRQTRIGLGGREFVLLKLRTMASGAERSGRLTLGADPRLTRVGGWLRRHKLDELPQLINVVRRDMSLVGPRPEVPEFVQWRQALQREALSVRPGLTDPASLQYVRESELLATAGDPAALYREVVLPAKLQLSVDYLRRRTPWTDVLVLCRTALCVLAPGRVATR